MLEPSSLLPIRPIDLVKAQKKNPYGWASGCGGRDKYGKVSTTEAHAYGFLTYLSRFRRGPIFLSGKPILATILGFYQPHLKIIDRMTFYIYLRRRYM